MKLCLPSDFDYKTLEKISCLNNNREIYEMYGNLNPSPFLSSGRGKNNDLLPKVDWPYLESYVSRLKSVGINFDYTINPSCIENYELLPKGREEVIEFVTRLREIGVKSVTVAIPALIEIIKNKVSSIDVCASAVIGIDTVNKAKFYESLGVDRLLLKEDISRDFKTMETIVNCVNIPVEVIVNSHCQFDCPLRSFHYNSISHEVPDNKEYYESYYTEICENRNLNEFLKIRWIRPEDLKFYEDIGISHFKIIGRTSSTEADLVRTCKAYIDRSFSGNYIELLYNFAKKANPAFYLDNRKLDGFITYFINKQSDCYKQCGLECNYCINYFNKNFKLEEECIKVQNKAYVKYGILNLLKSEELSKALFESEI